MQQSISEKPFPQKSMKVLVGCESSGVVRDAFAARGHDAWSCDILPASGKHLQCDVLSILHMEWDLAIFHPPCTYLSSSGMHRTTRGLRDAKHTEDALDFVKALMSAPIPKIAIENPIGVISTRIRKPDQYIQPHEFGENASKKTCLWLKGLPPLFCTLFHGPRFVGRKPRWANQTDSGQNRLSRTADRWQVRSQTYHGIANAMAHQWG